MSSAIRFAFCWLSPIALFIHQSRALSNPDLTSSVNSFGYEVTNELYNTLESAANIWISPFCLSFCFALLYPGTIEDTQTQIANVFHYPSLSISSLSQLQITEEFTSYQFSLLSMHDTPSINGSSVVDIANKIYISNTFQIKASYISALQSVNAAAFVDTDFNFSANDAAAKMNEWAFNQTNGVIEDIVPRLQDVSDFSMVAMSAMYINATFAKPFRAEQTSISPFYYSVYRESERADIHLMHQIGYFWYAEDDEHQFLKLEFVDDLFAIFALPKDTNSAIISDPDLLYSISTQLTPTYIALALPKISIQALYRLNKPLRDLGLLDVFNAKVADFDAMSDDHDIFLNGVVHETAIEMDEKGIYSQTEIEAQETVDTLDSVGETLPHPVTFRADHPFQMFIVDELHDDLVLFMGHITKPGIPEDAEQPSFDETSDDVWSDYKDQSLMRGKHLNYFSWFFFTVIVAIFAVVVAMTSVRWYQKRRYDSQRNVDILTLEVAANASARAHAEALRGDVEMNAPTQQLRQEEVNLSGATTQEMDEEHASLENRVR